MQRRSKSNDISPYTRVLNQGSTESVPDSVVIEVEHILAYDKKKSARASSSVNVAPLSYSTSSTLQNKLERLWIGKMLKGEDKRPKYSYFHALFNPTTPLDYLNNDINLADISAMMLFLLHKTPLVSTTESEDHSGDIFGLYVKNQNEIFACRRHIEILIDKIKTVTGDEWGRHCVTTLIHELAHAFMDPQNYDIGSSENCEFYHNIKMQNNVNIDFYTAREESLAEILMYKMIRMASPSIQNKYTDNTLRADIGNTKREFQYRIAAKMLDNDYDFAGWLRAKGGLSFKIKDSLAKDWLSRAQDLDNGSLTAADFYKWERAMKFPWIKK